MLWLKFLLVLVTLAVGVAVTRPFVRAGNDIQPRPGRLAAFIGLVIVGFAFIGVFGGGLRVCPNGEVALETLWGGVPTGRVHEPGVFYVAPLLGGSRNINLQVTARSRDIDAASSDQQDVTARITVNFSVKRESALLLYQEYRGEWEREILDPAIEFWSKVSTAQYTPIELLQKRDRVAQEILAGLQAAPTLRHFTIAAVNVENLLFSDAYTAAIEAKMVAAQKALEAENKLREVEFQAAQTVAQATADAEKIRIQASAIQQQGGAEYVNLQMIVRWDGRLPNTLIIGDGSSPFQILDVGNVVK